MKTFAEKVRESVARKVSKEMNGRWEYCGGRFRIFGIARILTGDRFAILWEIIHKFDSLTAKLGTEREFGIPDREQVFRGEEAFDECVNWVVDNLITVHDEIARKIAPYLFELQKFESALKGETQ